MTSAARVIPCLDVDAGRVVKGVNFVDLVDAGDPVELAARYDDQGADEVVFLDITASSDDRDTIVELASRTAEKLFIPFTIGGGIRTVDDARRLLRVGADKVAVNTAAVRRPQLVAEIAHEFVVERLQQVGATHQGGGLGQHDATGSRVLGIGDPGDQAGLLETGDGRGHSGWPYPQAPGQLALAQPLGRAHHLADQSKGRDAQPHGFQRPAEAGMKASAAAHSCTATRASSSPLRSAGVLGRLATWLDS